MKTNINRIQAFLNAAQYFIKEKPKEEKVITILRKVMEGLQPHFDEYWKLRKNIDLAHANTDKNGSLLYDPSSDGQRFAYTREGLVAREAALEQLGQEDRFEIEHIFLPQEPEWLDDNYRKAFVGFIIEPSESENE